MVFICSTALFISFGFFRILFELNPEDLRFLGASG